ncbi:hypothetical protein [Bradyrhizobium sp. AUGA SZCCT0182]|uniref:hypothetical protein n=1 Tax=Bradyrhizobium sp. AUGA SZCCT0182 TaxID=2807667 RepID=UPI001BA68E7A|nr:hypothetical protein [Bradyrhizobium sp. AUGA SZCCT0182]MBR1236611.1 hypothetical protein [Bradyrhizobium sp. AUGA SZCCT0182]
MLRSLLKTINEWCSSISTHGTGLPPITAERLARDVAHPTMFCSRDRMDGGEPGDDAARTADAGGLSGCGGRCST